MTKLYYAIGARDVMVGTLGHHHAAVPPANLLVTTHSFKAFETFRQELQFGTWCLDSGAFEAHSQGKPMEYSRWAEVARSCDADEVFGLDVIGDARATRANVERAWSDGIKAIPTFHHGSPWEYLEWAARSAPKMAMGGVARMPLGKRSDWLAACFKRAWPVRVHGFGVTSFDSMMRVPFHSVDSSTWTYAPKSFGRFRQLSQGLSPAQRRIPCPVSARNDLRGEMFVAERSQRMVRSKWRREMELLDQLPTAWFA